MVNHVQMYHFLWIYPTIYRVSMGFKHPNVAPELVDFLQDLSETFATVCEDRRAGMRHIRIYKYHI